MGSLETDTILLDAGGALRVADVGHSKVTGGWPSDALVWGPPRGADVGSSEPLIKVLKRHGVGPSGVPAWGPQKHWYEALRGGSVGALISAGVGPAQSPVKPFTGANVESLRDTGPSEARAAVVDPS